MVSDAHLVALPGLCVGVACLAWAVRIHRHDGGLAPRPWLALLLVGLGVFALVGWSIRPLLVDPRVAFVVGAGLLAWETLLHGVLIGVVSGFESDRARWLRSATGVGTAAAVILGFVALVLFVPRAFIGRVGALDGVPGLYRLAAGPAAVP